MEICIDKIDPFEKSDMPMMVVNVHFLDEVSEYHQSAMVTVFLEKKDYSLSELRDAAIRKAHTFLHSALNDRSS